MQRILTRVPLYVYIYIYDTVTGQMTPQSVAMISLDQACRYGNPLAI